MADTKEDKKLEIANKTIKDLEKQLHEKDAKVEQLISILDVNLLVCNMQDSLGDVCNTDPDDIVGDSDILDDCKKTLTKALNTLKFIEETFNGN
jgi:predicted RNase H-like nuclease (RuvC/YqgF family)